jgi:hypothetical protein
LYEREKEKIALYSTAEPFFLVLFLPRGRMVERILATEFNWGFFISNHGINWRNLYSIDNNLLNV